MRFKWHWYILYTQTSYESFQVYLFKRLLSTNVLIAPTVIFTMQRLYYKLLRLIYVTQRYIRRYEYFRFEFYKDRYLKIPQGIKSKKFFDVLRDSEILTGWKNLLSIRNFCLFDLWSFDVACIRFFEGFPQHTINQTCLILPFDIHCTKSQCYSNV